MYLNHNDLSKYWVLDIETDGLNPTVIWCVVAYNLGTKEWKEFYGSNLVEDVRNFWDQCSHCYFIGHNLLSFDIPVLERLAGISNQSHYLIDTLILSYLYNPRMGGGHSLEAYGERFGFQKIYHEDFSKFSLGMLAYCRRDVELTAKLFLSITTKMRAVGFSERSCKLEHEIRRVVNGQQRNGFWFDSDRAMVLAGEIRERQRQIGETVKVLIPDKLQPVHTYELRTRKDGTEFASYTRHVEKYPKITREGGTYTVWDWRVFNIGSPLQRLQKLLELGYTPTKKTKSGGLAADEDVLLDAAIKLNTPEIKAMADWIVCEGRANMIEKWIECYDPITHCIHGTVFSCGASTRRMTHSGPNTANIPKAKASVQYGKECRQLWRARPGRVLVGYDAKSLEMLMFCHYVNNPDVTRLYVEGDPHQRNADLLSDNPWGWVVERNVGAKNGFYAFLYGAQDPKLGRTLHPQGTAEFGAWARERLIGSVPGLGRFVEETQREFNTRNGWLETIDGGHIRCTSPHAAVNYKCQSAGGLVMKQASIFLDERIHEIGLDALKVGDIHDEGQVDVSRDDAERVGNEAVLAIKKAGEELGFNVPLDGDYKIGLTWAETH